MQQYIYTHQTHKYLHKNVSHLLQVASLFSYTHKTVHLPSPLKICSSCSAANYSFPVRCSNNEVCFKSLELSELRLQGVKPPGIFLFFVSRSGVVFGRTFGGCATLKLIE